VFDSSFYNTEAAKNTKTQIKITQLLAHVYCRHQGHVNATIIIYPRVINLDLN